MRKTLKNQGFRGSRRLGWGVSITTDSPKGTTLLFRNVKGLPLNCPTRSEVTPPLIPDSFAKRKEPTRLKTPEALTGKPRATLNRIQNCMPMYFVKTPRFVQNLFPQFLWRVPTKEKVLFLTFDDGPIPEVTPWVLEQLRAFDAKATFFCVGQNVERHPELLEAILADGHVVGNHTYRHLNGWLSDHVPYFHDVRRCAHLVRSELFRPPYGRLHPRQVPFLLRHYRVIMWDVLSGDFDQDLDGQACFDNVVRHAGPGSIVVFHDSLKAGQRLHEALPRVLEHFAKAGYRFQALEEKLLEEQMPAKKIA